MTNKQLYPQQKCQHLVLDECSQSHYDNCVGMQQCILNLEQKLKKTFTVDEIKEIINNYFIKEDDEAFYQVKDCRDYLLAEFEKEK